MNVESGLARITTDLVGGRSIGLVTNQTGVDSRFRRTAEVIEAAGGRIAALFGPEHGYYGVEADAVALDDEVQAGSVPVYSLYRPGAEEATYNPPPGSLNGLDALIFDIQDVGVRYYTYPSTLGILMEQVDVPIYVVDRPNPLGGAIIEGPQLDPAFASFVGRYRLPVRHGLTMGELARFINDRLLGGRAHLIVLPVTGWQRTMAWEESGLPWIAPSPNLPTLAAMRLYPGTCLLEGTNVSVGRGTTQPFEVIGAPWISHPERLAAAMNALNRPGVHFRATAFKPVADMHVGATCGGLQLHLTDPHQTPEHIVRTGLLLVATIAALYPAQFVWCATHFDNLIGSDIPRRLIANGGSLDTLFASWTADEASFAEERTASLLYV